MWTNALPLCVLSEKQFIFCKYGRESSLSECCMIPAFSLAQLVSVLHLKTRKVFRFVFPVVSFFFFYWKIIALQNFVVFCQTSTWISYAAAAAKSLQSCPTLCDPIESSPPGFPFPGILQARTPFPSPMRESEKWKWSRSVVSDSSDPMDCSLPGSSVHGIF